MAGPLFVKKELQKENGKPIISMITLYEMNRWLRKKIFVLFICAFFLPGSVNAFDAGDTSRHSTRQQAISYLAGITQLKPGKHWPNIQPSLFLENIRMNVQEPLGLYAGRGTNFCSYAALSYIPLNDDPLGFVKFLLHIYEYGTGTMGTVNFNPSLAVQKAAGSLKYKGKMDNRPADQLWLLVLADHFKGYLNFLNHDYDPGDEDRFWAASNFAKFNRMVRKLFNYTTEASGSDLIRPRKKDLAGYLVKKMDSGIVFLYVNNTLLSKKDHGAKQRLPSHYIVLQRIVVEGNLVTITYWDNGARTLQQVSKRFLKRIVFGVSYCKRKTANVS
jgi:hypothetical protein